MLKIQGLFVFILIQNVVRQIKSRVYCIYLLIEFEQTFSLPKTLSIKLSLSPDDMNISLTDEEVNLRFLLITNFSNMISFSVFIRLQIIKFS